jgi:hypothetical protein
LVEVSSHLNSCLLSLKSTDESVVQFDSIVIPNSIHADNLRQLMRKVEDDIISQMALLTNFRNTLNESVGEQNEDIANELVALLQRIGELESFLREKEADLTETQAKEAVLEAECASVRTILTKTSESLEKHQQDISVLNQSLEEERTEKLSLKQKLKKVEEDYLERQHMIKSLESRLEQSDQRSNPAAELQSLIYSKDAQLRISKECLEDWAIISRLSLETLSKFYSNWLLLEHLLNVRTPSPEIQFSELLDFDPESLPDELDQFLSAIALLSRQTYEKLSLTSHLNSDSITADLKSEFRKLKADVSRRVTFQK